MSDNEIALALANACRHSVGWPGVESLGGKSPEGEEWHAVLAAARRLLAHVPVDGPPLLVHSSNASSVSERLHERVEPRRLYFGFDGVARDYYFSFCDAADGLPRSFSVQPKPCPECARGQARVDDYERRHQADQGRIAYLEHELASRPDSVCGHPGPLMRNSEGHIECRACKRIFLVLKESKPTAPPAPVATAEVTTEALDEVETWPSHHPNGGVPVCFVAKAKAAARKDIRANVARVTKELREENERLQREVAAKDKLLDEDAWHSGWLVAVRAGRATRLREGRISMKKPPLGSQWRILHHSKVLSHNLYSEDYDPGQTGDIFPGRTIFDELVIKFPGGSIHLEQMSRSVWFLCIGEEKVMITVGKDGVPRVGEWYK